MTIDIATLASTKWEVTISDVATSSGAYAGTGGSPGLEPARFSGDMSIRIVVCSLTNESYAKLQSMGFTKEEIDEIDGQTFIRVDSARLANNSYQLVYTADKWSVRFWGSEDSSLKAYCDAGTTRENAYSIPSTAAIICDAMNKIILSGASGSAIGTMDYTSPNIAAYPSVGKTYDSYVDMTADLIGDPYHLVQTARIANWNRDDDKRELYWYVVGYVNTMSGGIVQTPQTQNCATFVVRGGQFETLFAYYPWTKYLGDWVSLNRSGANTDDAGLHRWNGSAWSRETNKPGNDSDEDHAHRYDGTAWVKSPKE